ncbi:MAG: DUF4340 domain-containing protein [Betaproteobacteria bacterium]
MRKFASTLIALAVLAVLGAYILFVEGVKPPDKNAGNVLVNVPASDISSVAVEQASGRVEVEKAAGSAGKDEWKITFPKAVAASDTAVKALVDAAAKLTCEKKVAEQVDANGLEAFGLSSPWLKVTLHTKEGEKTVLVGAETPVGGARYAELADSDTVYTLASDTVSALAKGLDDLREREIFAVSTDSITALRLVRPGATDIKLEKNKDRDEAEWRITEPFSDEADRWKVSDLIWDLSGLTVSEFVDDEGKDLARWGLDRPRLRVEANTSERASAFELLVGSRAPDGKGFYVRTSDSPSVYLVNPATFSPLETAAVDLVNKDLLSWNDDDLLRVTLAEQGRSVGLLKDGKEWRTAPPGLAGGTAAGALPQPAPAPQAPQVVKEGEGWQVKAAEKRYSSDDMSKLWSAVRDVTVANVVEGAASGVDDARYGLDRPRVKVELDLGDGKVLELKIGAKAAGENGYYASVTGRRLVYLVQDAKVQALESAIEEFL